MDTQNKPNN